jgi:ATP synthase protein I
MDDPPEKAQGPQENAPAFEEKVRAKELRKVRARREREQNRRVWFGLGMFGLVGWSVAIPTLLGIALGVWIDMKYPGRVSWTLMLMFIGVILGCLNAWYWVQRESRRDQD